ncbi:MAG: hypothetical protein RLN81_15135 [Balneolaceae bacterium]
MGKTIIFLLLIFSFNCKAQEEKPEFKWDLEQERIHNENRNDSTTWNYEIWKDDTLDLELKGKPIISGVFPVPKYELIDSTFNGLGYSGNWTGYDLKDKKIVHHSLYVTKNGVNKEYISDKANEVFFTIAVLTDSVDLKGYTHTNVGITSRNHPHHVGQGFVKTKSNEIEFVSFITADRNNYALINMRLFDLKIGRIVLIAPQKDGTLRSLQLNSPIMSSEEIDKYIEELMSNDKTVIDFFTKAGTI